VQSPSNDREPSAADSRLRQQPPPIAPLPEAPSRPEFSVMIPTYRPSAHLLETLASVLVQDPGADALEIAVVDDCSPGAGPQSLIAAVAPHGRVTLHRHPANAGLAGNWNRCIEHARGRLIHILHQDDRVKPGFYRTLSAAFRAAPQAVMAFCRCDFIDASGRPLGATHRRALRAGVMRDWLARCSEATRVQCPGVVVPRRTYERLGGYRTDLRYAIDWEMWVRIAAAGEVWYEPQALATYRKHDANATTRLEASDVTDGDMLAAIRIFSGHLPDSQRTRLLGRTYREFVRLRLRHSARLGNAGERSRIAAQVALARRLMSEFPTAASWANRWRLRRLEQRLAAGDAASRAGAPE
jgi:GT2 family glycosyltransferase